MNYMRRLANKLKDALSLKFKDSRMESEYSLVKTQNSLSDFRTAVLFMIILQILALVTSSTTKRFSVFYINIATTVFIVILLPFERVVKKNYQYLTLLALCAFSLSRIAILWIQYEFYNKVTTYYVAYMYACIQVALLTKIQHVIIQIVTILLFLGMRYVVIFIVDQDNFDVYAWVRFLLTDMFIIYVLYSNEATARRVFRNFFENRDELIKFKELLADSLPQSLVIVDLKTQKQLFANNMFLSSFDMEDPLENAETDVRENQSKKLNFKFLQMDLTTLRDVGNEGQNQNGMFSLAQTFCEPNDLLKKLSDDNILQTKALCVNASYSQFEKQRTLEVTLKKIKWDRIDAIAVILNDTTYRESLVALKLANVNKDQIIATVSHELRTPLHGIIGLLEIVESKVKDVELLKNLSLCKDNATLLSSLVNSLLDLQQLTTGKLKLNEGKINITKSFQDVIQLFKFQADQKGIGLELEVHKDVTPMIVTDENRLKQIMINLIGNAIKFTFKGGVKVEVFGDSTDPAFVQIEVSDTGIGIKQEDMGKLFKMYGKLANGSAVNRNGVGLGLTISNTLACLLNGQSSKRGIEVASEYGIGSKFSFKVLKDLRSAMPPIPEEPSQQKGAESIRLERGLTESLGQEEYFVEEEHSPRALNIFPLSSRVSIYMPKSNDLSHHELKKRWTGSMELISEPSLKDDRNRSHSMLIQKNQSVFNTSVKKESDSTRKECVLVVDDNPFNILIAKSLLKDIGFEVKSASGGQEAITIVQQCMKEGMRIKVIFMDCQMPIMDGYETARTLKSMMQNGEVPETPILAWTANNGEHEIQKCFESGMSGYLSKPTTKENVLKAIPK